MIFKRRFLFTTTCRGCGRQISQRVPVKPDSVDDGVRIRCRNCGRINSCRADRDVPAPEVEA